MLHDAFEQLGPAHGVVAAYLYGSHARGEARPESDIDVAVLFGEDSELSALDVLRLGQKVEDRTGLKNLDVRRLNDAPLSAKGGILAESILVYSGDDSARVDFEVRTRGMYFDFLPHLRYLQKEFIRRTAERGL